MDLKKEYYKLGENKFKQQLSILKSDESTIHFFSYTKKPYFYCSSVETKEKLLLLEKAKWEFDKTFEMFSSFAKKQLIQSFLLDEIQHTNEIENIHSTRHDIFSIIETGKQSGKEKIVSLVNAYLLLLTGEGIKISTLTDIKGIYMNLIGSVLKGDDKPDGEFFRKKPVFITNGIENIHAGIDGENNINHAMEEWLSIYNSDMDTLEKMLLSHFLIESIHPYYDGNGRLGRFLISNGILLDDKSCSAFVISKSFSREKGKYYKAFENGNDVHQYGCVNIAVEQFADVLIHEFEKETISLKNKLKQIDDITAVDSLTKTGEIVYKLLKEASILTDFGISNKEIMNTIDISKRNLMYIMNELREMKLLEDTKIGKTTYHKIV